MKSILIILFLSNLTFAISPQFPDLLIIENDTIPIYHLPLEIYLKKHEPNYINQVRKPETGFLISFNCWRGYQGVWKIKNDKLYLIDIISCGFKEFDNSKEVLKKTFLKKYKDGQVHADWFSSNLTIPKGEMLKWDGIFKRTYVKELIFTFKKGKLINKKVVQNYVDLEDGISRMNKKHVIDSIFSSIKQLNWTELGNEFCDDEYNITINKYGRINKIKLVPYLDSKWDRFWVNYEQRKCIRKLKKKPKTPSIRFTKE